MSMVHICACAFLAAEACSHSHSLCARLTCFKKSLCSTMNHQWLLCCARLMEQEATGQRKSHPNAWGLATGTIRSLKRRCRLDEAGDARVESCKRLHYSTRHLAQEASGSGNESGTPKLRFQFQNLAFQIHRLCAATPDFQISRRLTCQQSCKWTWRSSDAPIP